MLGREGLGFANKENKNVSRRGSSNYTKNLLREIREDALLLNAGNINIE